eukprot:gene2397-13395_t
MQAEQHESQLRVSELQRQQEDSAAHADQLKLLREQHQQLLELQRQSAAGATPTAPRAAPAAAKAAAELPEQIRNMARAIQRLHTAKGHAAAPPSPPPPQRVAGELARLADAVNRMQPTADAVNRMHPAGDAAYRAGLPSPTPARRACGGPWTR